jgi:proteic killer suppression protein
MDVDCADDTYLRLETDLQFTGGFSVEIVKSFRKKMGFIRQAVDERDIAAMRGLNFEKLRPPRDHERSVRLNKQWRLIFQLVEGPKGKTVRVIGIEDYH